MPLLAALHLLFSPAFTLFASPVTWLEIVAFVLAIWMVVCNIRVNPTGWPLAIVSSLLYFALFWENRLYGDASLQLVFVVVAAWGWRQWLRGARGSSDPANLGGVTAVVLDAPASNGPPADHQLQDRAPIASKSLQNAKPAPLKVRSMSTRGMLTTLTVFLVMWPLIGVFLDVATDTDVPYFDAFPTAGSLIGQWLLGRKYVENWPTWIAVNIVSVGLFAYKGLWLTVVLYAVFVVMAFIGLQAWRRLATASTRSGDGVAAGDLLKNARPTGGM
ncbi:nicotinamide riboside transporter PnuC [soil metagenome]